jgi:hypothetical protein
VNVERLCHEQTREREVDRRTVEVEGVTGWHHEPHDGWRAADSFELRHQLRKRRLRRRSAEHDGELFPQIREQAHDRQPEQAQSQAQHHEHEQDRSAIKRQHQLGQTAERADAVFSDRERHRAERAEGRELHHEPDDAEQRRRDILQYVEERFRALAQARQYDAGQDREEQHLQHVAPRECAKERVRNNRQQVLDEATRMRRRQRAIEGRLIEFLSHRVQAGARPHEMRHRDADEQRERGREFEPDEGLGSGAADGLQIFHARNAEHERREHDGRDQHLDQAHEAISERLHRDAPRRTEPTQKHGQRDRHQHLRVQARPARLRVQRGATRDRHGARR